MDLHNLPLDPLREQMSRSADKGGIPAPNGYAEDGRPLWSVEALAQFFGKTPAQIEADLNDAFENVADVMWSGPVHRVQ
jgi:hypothetical protein